MTLAVPPAPTFAHNTFLKNKLVKPLHFFGARQP